MSDTSEQYEELLRRVDGYEALYSLWKITAQDLMNVIQCLEARLETANNIITELQEKNTMKVYDTVQITQSQVTARYCDKCGIELSTNEYSDKIDDFLLLHDYGEKANGCYESRRVEDLCNGCIDILFSLLKANGFTVTKSVIVQW